MNHKEMTAHLRNRIQAAGIKAKCKMQAGGVIAVDVPAYGLEFSEDEQRAIRLIAKVNRLTWVQGMEIDVERMTDPFSFKFHMPAA